MTENERSEIKSLLTEEQKEKCKQYVGCKDCHEFEKYYSDGMCYYVFANEKRRANDDRE